MATRGSPWKWGRNPPHHNDQEFELISALTNVHDGASCIGDRVCVIHNPTVHLMRDFPLHWRSDRGIFERICPCGIGHPDPDQRSWWEESGQSWQWVHGCCAIHCHLNTI